MKGAKWLAYNDLAWTDAVVSSAADYEEETEFLAGIIKEHAAIDVRSLLHLGCGAGYHDAVFKRHFSVTGVDLSPGMLDMARSQNGEIDYHLDDMRTVRLEETFDAVVIPDSIGYLTTGDDLKAALVTAAVHLKPGGVMLIVAHTREEFRENNFVYTGDRDDIEVTIFENNRIIDADRTGYECVLVYLIRRAGELEFYTDRHRIGLFERARWMSYFKECGFEVIERDMMDNYGRHILGEGEYPQTIFVCRKPTNR